MTLTVLLYTDHQIIKMVHTFISMMFLIVALLLFYRSLTGYFRNRCYTLTDKVLSFAFIINLYLQLIFGFILMVSPAILSGKDMATNPRCGSRPRTWSGRC